jgi:hypothetical protein
MSNIQALVAVPKSCHPEVANRYVGIFRMVTRLQVGFDRIAAWVFAHLSITGVPHVRLVGKT